MRQKFLLGAIFLMIFSCEMKEGSIVLRDVKLPIDFLSIQTPLPFKIGDKQSFKLGCEPNNEKGFWRQAYFHGNEDTTICVSIINKTIDYKNFLNSNMVEEFFVSCLENRGGITSSGTHLFTRDYLINSDFLKVTTVSKYDSLSLVTNKTYYRKSISIQSSNHNISVIFRITIDDKISFESAVKHFEDYKVQYFP